MRRAPHAPPRWRSLYCHHRPGWQSPAGQRDSILVNAVCPSRIKTPLTDGLKLHNEVFLGRSLEQQESRWGAEVPLGRWGEPEDVASAVAFLASERAGFVVGAN